MEKPKIFEIDNTCTGCGACVSVCPKNCLRLEQDSEGFYYPSLKDGCIECKRCEKACHVLNPDNKKAISREDFYTYISQQTGVREKSSSGGAFTLFANYVLDKGGIIYSTLFNPQTQRVEVSNSDLFPLDKFRKSKYVESFSGESFKAIRNELKKDRIVLFCGTPCQVSGLKQHLSSLKEDSSQLLTIDFICHGVPSQSCFKSFISRNKRSVKEVDFRYKDFSKKNLGWHDMVYCEYYNNGSKQILTPRNLHYYYYYIPFMDNIMLRKCCYSCDEISHSSADISIGDFWSIHKDKSINDDNKGVSIVKIHTHKALVLWERLKTSGHVEDVSFDIVKSQFSSHKTGLLEQRNIFFEEVKSKGYIPAIRKFYFKKFIKDTIIRYGYNIKSWIIKK